MALMARLRLLMFGQYFMFGAWSVTLGTYMSKALHFDGLIGLAYATQGLAAIASTLFVGVIADRAFSAQRVLAVLLAISGATLFWLASVKGDPALFLGVVTLHFLAFVPTIPLSNAVAFNALADTAAQFPRIRVFGTVGWIAAGVLVGGIVGAAESALPMLIAGAAGLVLAAYALTLPNAPPRGRGQPFSLAGALGLDVLGEVRETSFWVLIAASGLITVSLAFYYAYCNDFLQEAGASVTILGKRFEAMALQSLGQVSELFFLSMLPLFLKRLGIKGVMIMGMAGWIVRYALFGLGFSGVGPTHTPVLVAAILLHGICYDFILVAASLYVDQVIAPAGRSRAQSFLTMLTMGAAILVGSSLANMVYRSATLAPNLHDWRAIWAAPAVLSAVTLALFLAVFRTPPAITREAANQAF